MPTRPPFQSLFANTRKLWAMMVQFAAFIFGVISSFLLPPPGWAAAGNRIVVRLAQFIVAVLVGLIFVLVQKWSAKRHVRRWVILTIVCLGLSIAAFFVYQYFLDTRTCAYAGQAVVIGTSYTEHAQAYLSQNRNSTCSSLLEDFGGTAEDIWLGKSINNSRYLLASTYILTLPLLTICIVAVVQAIYCSQAKTGRSRKS